MSSERIRIGIVGAGANTRLRHIPGLRAIDDVEITAVVNRSPQSTSRVAQEFEIPHAFERWQDLVDSPEIDAVVIGTWPNIHCEVACAALAAGKHVLTEARMARNLAEARQMVEAAKARSDLIAQIVPSPFGLVCGPVISHLLQEHFLGDLREIVVLGADSTFWDYSKPLHWRQDAELSGKNVLTLGILHETLLRWAPPPVQVYAQSELFEPNRPVPTENRFADVTVPDSLQIVTQHQGGARGMYHLSGVILFGPGQQIHLYGSRGTIKVIFDKGEERVYVGRANDKALYEMTIPEEDRGKWQVEEDFIASIREGKPVTLTDFKTGLKYMEFVEAVSRSAEHHAPVAV